MHLLLSLHIYFDVSIFHNDDSNLIGSHWICCHSFYVMSIHLFFADGSFLRTLASSLIDFNELSSVAALNMLLEVGFFFM